MSRKRLTKEQQTAHRSAQAEFAARELAASSLFDAIFAKVEVRKRTERIDETRNVLISSGSILSEPLPVVSRGELLGISLRQQVKYYKHRIGPEDEGDPAAVHIVKRTRNTIIVQGDVPRDFLRPWISEVSTVGGWRQRVESSTRMAPDALSLASKEQELYIGCLGLAAAELQLKVDQSILNVPEA